MLSKPSPAVDRLMNGDWSHLKPQFTELQRAVVNQETVAGFLEKWSVLDEQVSEAQNRLFVATTCDTADKKLEQQYQIFIDTISPEIEHIEQELKEKLLGSKAEPEGFVTPLKKLRADAELYCVANVEVESHLSKLELKYNRLTGGRSIQWEGAERTSAHLRRTLQSPKRDSREKVWRALEGRSAEDREEIASIWRQTIDLRVRLAKNTNLGDYRSYRWKQLHRFDYTPEQVMAFHKAIEDVAVPAATSTYKKRQDILGLKSLRPWDLDVDPLNRGPLRPFGSTEELSASTQSLFEQLDPTLGAYFKILRDEQLLDLDNRKNKAPIGYCIRFAEARRPFIFTNAVGVQRDVQTLLHEGGHAFHAFEANALPYAFQRPVGAEFSEVASMTMEFLGQGLIHERDGGFYNDEDSRRSTASHLEGRLILWPRVAMVDSFQHWVYENPEVAKDPDNCDQKWLELQRRFIPAIDISGLEHFVKNGWQNIPHIHSAPFYYVEYGMALLGAVQIWANALDDRAEALRRYRSALALGGTADLPTLYAAAGAEFSLDHKALRKATGFIMSRLAEL